MKGTFRLRGCTCKKKRCTCGALWYYRYDITDPITGKRKQKEAGGFGTKPIAEAEANKIQRELESGTYSEKQNITFEQLAEDWLKEYSLRGSKKPGTIRIRNHERNNLLPYFAKLQVSEITLKKYQDAILDLHKKLADNTLAGIHSTGRNIFKQGMRDKIIKEDPTVFAYLPKTTKTIDEIEDEKDQLPKYMEKEQLAHFINTVKDHGLERDYEIFVTLAYTGLRVGELCALREPDINTVRQEINITKTYYNPTNNVMNYQLVPPKTKKSVRKVSIDEDLLILLDKLRIRQSEVRLRLGDKPYIKKFVFAKVGEYAGYPEYIKFIENRMARLIKIAKLNPELTPHSLRHTHCSLLAEAGASLEQIMERLGHGDDEVTRLIYLHVTEPMKKEASHKFSQLMKSLS